MPREVQLEVELTNTTTSHLKTKLQQTFPKPNQVTFVPKLDQNNSLDRSAHAVAVWVGGWGCEDHGALSVVTSATF